MIIKRRVIYLFLFFLLNNAFFIHAVDLTVPSIGSGGAEVGKAISSVVQHVVTSPAGESLLRLLAKSFIPWIPTVIMVGGTAVGGFFLTKYTLALVYKAFNNIKESIDNVTDAPGNVKKTKEKVDNIEKLVEGLQREFGILKDEVTKFIQEIDEKFTEFSQDFAAKIAALEIKISNKIKKLSKNFKVANKIVQERTLEIRENTSETLQQVQQLQTDFIDLKDCFNIIAQQYIETKQFTEDQSKLLVQMFKMLIDIKLGFEDVPKNVIETKDAVGNMIESKQRAESALQQTNTTTTTTTLVQLTGNRGMSGSSIFTTVIEPKMNKLEETVQEKHKEINQALEKIQNKNVKSKNKKARLLQEFTLLKNSVQQLQSTFQDHYRYNNQKEKELLQYKALFYYSVISNAQKQLEQKNMASERLISPQVITNLTTTSNILSIGFEPNFLPEPASMTSSRLFPQSSSHDSVFD